jgi:hypothetical protein
MTGKNQYPYFETHLSLILRFYEDNALSAEYDWEVLAVDNKRDRVIFRGSPTVFPNKKKDGVEQK